MHHLIECNPNSLLFDVNNFRLPKPAKSQKEALEGMARIQQAKLVNLAADIVDNKLNPGRLLYVTQKGDRYIVHEGNRRLSAIRALEAPTAIQDILQPKDYKRLAALSKKYHANPLGSVMAICFPSESQAYRWIVLDHAGENEGRGLTKWGPLEIARFKGAPRVEVAVIDYLRSHQALPNDGAEVKNVSTLRRILSTPEVRKKCGIDFHGGVLTLHAHHDEIKKRLVKIVNDVSRPSFTVDQVKTKEQRLKYAKAIPEIPVSKVLVPGVPSAEDPPTPSSARRRTTASGAQRDKLIPKQLKLNIENARISQIAAELKKLSVSDFTNSVSVMFRVFTELSIDCYLQRQGKPPSKSEKLQAKFAKVRKELHANGATSVKEDRALQKGEANDFLLGGTIITMHEYVHNEHCHPIAKDLIRGFDNLEPLFREIWK